MSSVAIPPCVLNCGLTLPSAFLGFTEILPEGKLGCSPVSTEVNAKICVDFSWTSDNAVCLLLKLMFSDSENTYWLERLGFKIRILTPNIFYIKCLHTGKKEELIWFLIKHKNNR